MKPVSKLSNTYRIMVRDVDFTEKLKLSAAFNFFEEIAGLHSDRLGIGFNTIEKNHGVAWVLTRMRVDINRYPLWDEEVIVETWPQLPRKYEFDRDYLIKDLEGNILVRAVSAWVILDVSTRELRKTDVIAINYPEIITERAIDCTLLKVKPAGQRELAYKRVIGCSDIDMNGHLNNSKYIDFAMDCFSMDELRKYQAKSITVNYLGEAFPGDTILLYKYMDNSEPFRLYIEGINEKEEKSIFKSQIDIEKRNI